MRYPSLFALIFAWVYFIGGAWIAASLQDDAARLFCTVWAFIAGYLCHAAGVAARAKGLRK